MSRSARRQAGRWGCLLTIGAVVAIAAIAVWWLNPVHNYYSLRDRVHHQVGTERLQEWAVTVLDNPPKAERILRADLPEDIRVLADGDLVEYVEASPQHGVEEHILFACGGGFFHYGLRVGRKGYQPDPDTQFRFEKLGDGIWGMYER